MSSKFQSESPTAQDLPITLYLNQRWVFDILAALEGGYSEFTTMKLTEADTTASEQVRGFNIGFGNRFALIEVKLGGQRTQKQDQTHSEDKTETLVHTPSSLFSRLRLTLRERKLVIDIAASEDISQIQPGNFVEFEATLRRSPPVEFLEAFEKLISLFDIFDTTPNKTRKTSNSKGNSQKNRTHNSQSSGMLNEIKAMRKALTDEGKAQDLVAEAKNMQAVLPVEQNYFSNPSMNDIIDGTFRVFGKVVDIVPEKGDNHINLLRKTAFGTFGKLEELFGILESSMALPNSPRNQLGFTGSLSPRIEGPSLLVIPIAIFA